MNGKRKQFDVFNEAFLCESLNIYEGNAAYFKPLNAQFAAYLVLYFKRYDFLAFSPLLFEITETPAYKSHPFIPFILEHLDEVSMRKTKPVQISKDLSIYHYYPLADYVKIMLAPNGAEDNFQTDFFTLLLHYLKNPAENTPNLRLLSKSGFAFATFRLILLYLEGNEYSELENMLLLLVSQNGGEEKATVVIYLEWLLHYYEFTHLEICRLLVKYGATRYLMDLVVLYEKHGDFTAAFFVLHYGQALGVKEASDRLLTYYKTRKNLPTNEEIIKYLENNIN